VRTRLLLAQMDEAYARLVARLEGLTDQEFFWQPVPNCWTVFQDPSGRWTYHYEEPDPVPAPMTSIGWQFIHVAMCKVMYHEWAFGAQQLTWLTIDTPHSVAEATEVLERGQRLLRADLVQASEEDLDHEVLTNWGERWPAWRIFSAMIDHDALHTGAIGQLRDAYYWRTPSP
jgi:hypothetical protein